jgi:uncharacterized Ntn-hydrolase superfamily protein
VTSTGDTGSGTGDVPRQPLLATFSIAARDEATGMLGVAVSSKATMVGALCPFVGARVGAVATQAWVNPSLGPRILVLLAAGRGAREALDEALAGDRRADLRQVNVVDARGGSASHTGANADPWCGGRVGPGYAIAGNILVSEETVAAMEAAFVGGGDRDFADRLIGVLEAGQAAGGDARGRQGAALLIMHETELPFLRLHVEDHPDPVGELRRVYAVLQAEDDEAGGTLGFAARVAAAEGWSEDQSYPDEAAARPPAGA